MMDVLRHAVRRPSSGMVILPRTAQMSQSRFYSSSTTSRNCPSCSSPLLSALPTCLKCSYIAPLPNETTYFDVLGLPSSGNKFNVDKGSLKKNFLQAQRVCHPDAWSGKGEKEQNIASAQSSLLNEAFKTLSSPLQRAQYILTLAGHPSSETDKLTDEMFIMDVMEEMEQIEAATTLDTLENIRSENDANIENLHQEISGLIEGKDWEGLANAVTRLKYLDNIEAAAKQKMDDLS